MTRSGSSTSEKSKDFHIIDPSEEKKSNFEIYDSIPDCKIEIDKDIDLDKMICSIKEKHPVNLVKIYWDDRTFREVTNDLKSLSVYRTFEKYQGKIPMRTLNHWKKNPTRKNHSNKGRRTKLKILEGKLCEWFLWNRARGCPLNDTALMDKAKKIRDKLLVLCSEKKNL